MRYGIDSCNQGYQGNEEGKAVEKKAMERTVFASGFSPDRCLFRGRGYITPGLIDIVRSTLMNGEELSDTDIVSICHHAGIFEHEASSREAIASRIYHCLEGAANFWANDRTDPLNVETEMFLARCVGWRDYCLFKSILANGGVPCVLCRQSESDISTLGFFVAEKIAEKNGVASYRIPGQTTDGPEGEENLER